VLGDVKEFMCLIHHWRGRGGGGSGKTNTPSRLKWLGAVPIVLPGDERCDTVEQMAVLARQDKESKPVAPPLCAIVHGLDQLSAERFRLSLCLSSHSIEYWFRCMDLDGDGVLSLFELVYFYEEVLQRLLDLDIDCLSVENTVCQILDMVNPRMKGGWVWSAKLLGVQNCL